MSDEPKDRRRSDRPAKSVRYERVWSESRIIDSAPVEVGVYHRATPVPAGLLSEFVVRVEIGGCAIELNRDQARALSDRIRYAGADVESREFMAGNGS